MVNLYKDENGTIFDNQSDIDISWVKMTDEEVEEFLNPTKPLEQIKLEKLVEINITYEEKAKSVKVDTPESEVLTWDIQKTEVEAWQKDNTVATPFIDKLAESREIERFVLIEKITAKVLAFNQYMADLTGTRQKLEDRIKNASSVEEVEVVSWEK